MMLMVSSSSNVLSGRHDSLLAPQRLTTEFLALTGTDPGLHQDVGATWVLITGWLDELRELAAAPAPTA